MNRKKRRINMCVTFNRMLLPVGFLCVSFSQAKLSLIPLPLEIKEGKGSFHIKSDTVILAKVPYWKKAKQLSTYLESAIGHALPVISPSGKQENVIRFVHARDSSLGKEGYQLSVTPHVIEIRASSEAGAFYAIQTLRQLLPPPAFRSPTVETRANGINIPVVTIKDKPPIPVARLHAGCLKDFY